MQSFKKIIVYGFLTWLIPLIVSFAVFPFHESNRALFESVMAIAVSGAAVWLAALYFSQARRGSIGEGVVIGLIWIGINLVLDYFVFIRGPVQMVVVDYIYDIALTYVIFLVVVPAAAFIKKKSKESEQI